MGRVLTLPDVRQPDPHSCGPAVVRTVCKFFGVRASAAKADPLDGMHPSYAEAALRLCGLRTCSGEMDLTDLAYHTRRGRPVVTLVRHHDSGHYVVVAGLDRRRVFFQCPLDGPASLKRADFEARWLDHDRTGQPFRRWGLAAASPAPSE